MNHIHHFNLDLLSNGTLAAILKDLELIDMSRLSAPRQTVVMAHHNALRRTLEHRLGTDRAADVIQHAQEGGDMEIIQAVINADVDRTTLHWMQFQGADDDRDKWLVGLLADDAAGIEQPLPIMYSDEAECDFIAGGPFWTQQQAEAFAEQMKEHGRATLGMDNSVLYVIQEDYYADF